MKKITVILPIYEVKGRTSKCLDSILKQKDVEILCICYDDMVEEQVNELDYDNKIVVKKVNNLKGIFEFVNGEYVTVVNSDDYLLPNMYEKILQLNKTGDVDIIKTSFFELKECEEMDNLSNYLSTIEHSMKDSKFSIFTQTVIRNKVVGFSAVEQELGELLQHWETPKESKEEHTAVDETLKTKEIELIQVKKEETDTKEVVQASDANEGEDSEHKKTDEDQSDESYIRGFQKAAWEKRGGNKPFQNADRIAVFQFRIDSSYKHPSAEKCSRKEYEEKKSENMGYYLSCAEFRRRNLLKTVMKTCHLFDVDILLLPEYSVRPETVIWMRNQIEEKGYHFSVWAGTFRIPAGYRMEGDLAELDMPFNKKYTGIQHRCQLLPKMRNMYLK